MKCIADKGTCGLGGYCDECPWPEIESLRSQLEETQDINRAMALELSAKERECEDIIKACQATANETEADHLVCLLSDGYDAEIIQEYILTGIRVFNHEH